MGKGVKVLVALYSWMAIVLTGAKAEALFLAPGNSGLSGTPHVFTADNVGSGNWAFRAGFTYINYRDFYNPGLQNNTFRIVNTSFFMTTSLGPVGELTVGTGGRVARFHPVGGYPADFASVGDVKVALKLGYMTGGGVGAAIYGLADMVTDRNDLNYDIFATSAGGGLIFSLDFWKMKRVPLRFHINVGYYYDRKEHLFNAGDYTGFFDYFYRIYHDDAIDGGVALEVPLKYVTPFIEYWTHQIIDADGDNDTSYHYGDSPQYISVGARVTPLRGFTIDLYYDQSLSSKLAGFFYRYEPWRVGFALAYTFLPRKPKVEYTTVMAKAPEKPKGVIRVAVKDAKDDTPLQDAILRFAKRTLPAIATDKKGEATIRELPPDEIYKAEVYAEGYKRKIVRLRSIKDNKMYVVKLEPISPPHAVLMGTVVDEKGRPLIATIKFKNTSLGAFATNPVSGMFRKEVPPGKHVIEISAKGYESLVKTFTADKNSVVYVDVVLKKMEVKPPTIKLRKRLPVKH